MTKGWIKRLLKIAKLKIGQKANIWLAKQLISKAEQKDQRIANVCQDVLTSQGYRAQAFKICMINEGQCMRGLSEQGRPSQAWGGITMPIARLLAYQKWFKIKKTIKPALLFIEKTKKKVSHLYLNPTKENKATQANILSDAGLFHGLSYRYLNVLSKSEKVDSNYYSDLSRQASRYLKLLKDIDMQSAARDWQPKQSSNRKIGILISCFNPEPYIQGFLENIQQISIRERVIPVFINAGMSRECRNLITAETKNAGFADSIFIDKPGCKIYEAWNLGIEALSNRVDFLTNFNVDDRRHPLCIEVQSSYLETFSDKQVAITDYLYFSNPNQSLEKIVSHSHQYRTNIPVVNKRTLVDRNFPHSSPMWRYSLHGEASCQMFDSSYTSAGDADFWYRVSRENKNAFGVISIPLSFYYNNPNGLSTRPQTIGLQEHQRSTINHYELLCEQMIKEVSPEFAEKFFHRIDPEHLHIYAAAAAMNS
ncbi:hypothetical protein [Prochlorococcus sp. MIT 1201]|uniref:hypothetical protein n=1 Tax=Prochlorococcus sp. MIT 1201 TaxID=3082535 RepID=UPI0039A5446D